MNEELNLDALKRVWNSQSNEKTYSQNEIFKILKRKSITSIKWVFIISLIELIVGIVIYIYLFSTINLREYHNQLMSNIGNWAYAYEFLTFIVYGATALFIYQFFKSYRVIQVHSSVKDLSKDIIKFRKVVNTFIYFNLIVLFVLYVIVAIPVVNNFPELQGIDWLSITGLSIIVGLIVIFAAMLVFLWLYYYLVYGTFQRRLKRNLNDLDSIES